MSPIDLRDYLLWFQVSSRASSTINTHASLISMLRRNNAAQRFSTRFSYSKKLTMQLLAANVQFRQCPFVSVIFSRLITEEQIAFVLKQAGISTRVEEENQRLKHLVLI